MTTVNGTTGTTTGALTGTTAGTTKSSLTTAASTVDKDMFLQLLVAQLKYQDPTKPVDSSQFMTQTAQFTMVEQLTNVAKSQSDMLAAQRMATATAMVGRTIAYNDATGMPATGVVTSVSFSGSSPTLRVGNTDVPLSSVKEVKTASA
ncbi:MAG: flagellar hook capping protein [Micromonosporaceae bacterium]|nr:flagellar hook capping protein [Micromonosporaceae bacterium]